MPKRTLPSPLRPQRGSLYKRANGKYIPASSEEPGTYYYEFRLLPDVFRRSPVRICLDTEDVLQAKMRAESILFLNLEFAKKMLAPHHEKIIKSMGITSTGILQQLQQPQPVQGYVSQYAGQMCTVPAMMPQVPPVGRIRLSDVFAKYAERNQTKERTVNLYRCRFNRFTGWLEKHYPTVKYANELTQQIAEEYLRDLYASKSSAEEDRRLLVRVWSKVFPNNLLWQTDLKLVPKINEQQDNYRAISPEEATAVYRELCLKAADASTAKHSSFAPGDLKAAEMRDAFVMSHYYGMRIGSFTKFEWEHIDFEEGYFSHVPPKTETKKPQPLFIPLVPEVVKVLQARKREITERTGVEPVGLVFPNLVMSYKHNASAVSAFAKRIFMQAKVFDDYRLGRASWHSLRASFVTHMDEAHVQPAITDSITGHARQDNLMHNRYSHTSIDCKRMAILEAIKPLGI